MPTIVFQNVSVIGSDCWVWGYLVALGVLGLDSCLVPGGGFPVTTIRKDSNEKGISYACW